MGIWINFCGVPQGLLSQSLTAQIMIYKTLQIHANIIRYIQKL